MSSIQKFVQKCAAKFEVTNIPHASITLDRLQHGILSTLPSGGVCGHSSLRKAPYAVTETSGASAFVLVPADRANRCVRYVRFHRSIPMSTTRKVQDTSFQTINS